MPEFCSCGAQLPDDALFCHKCGKPQRDLVEVEPQEPAPTPVVQAVPPSELKARPVGFRNPIALRVALLSAIVSLLISSLVSLFGLIAGGFLAVMFYRRRTRDRIDMNAGIQMGWITGVITATLCSLLLIAANATGRLTQGMTEYYKGWAIASDPNFQNSLQLVTSPAGIALSIVFIFIFITALTMVGGAIGAKLLGRS
jgi:hypothetical protein